MNRLQAVKNGRSMADVVAKSTASREKLNLLMANTSTPKNNRAFFVCSTRTPKENRLAVFLSMVGYSGRYFTDCLPLTTASHTAVPYRQTVESLAVDSKNQLMESIKMNPYTLKAYTGNQSYALNPEKMNRLQAVKNGRSMVSTTTFNGNRNRYTSGIFLPQVYHFKQWHGFTTGVIHSLKLVTRATPRNKTGIRANKWGFSYEAVEPLLHLYRILFKSVLQVLITKYTEGISMLYTYLFKGIARRDLSNTRKSIDELPTYTLRKQAESEQQARAFFAPFYVILEGGKLC